jgi:hypothetical protein
MYFAMTSSVTFPHEKPVHLHDPFGLVRDVAGQWSSSNGSPPLSFDCGPRQLPPHNNHDTIFLITTSAPSPTPSPQVCPRGPPHGVETQESLVTKAAYDDRRPSIPLLPSLLRPHRHSKPIARPFQTASFKRLYRKRSGARDSLVPETLSCRSVPDTALTLNGRFQVLRLRRKAIHWTEVCSRQESAPADPGPLSGSGASSGRNW